MRRIRATERTFGRMATWLGRMDIEISGIMVKLAGNPEFNPFGRMNPCFGRMDTKKSIVSFLRMSYFVGYLGLLFPLVPMLYIPLFPECNVYAYFESFLPQLRTSFYLLSIYISFPSLDFTAFLYCFHLHSSIVF